MTTALQPPHPALYQDKNREDFRRGAHAQHTGGPRDKNPIRIIVQPIYELIVAPALCFASANTCAGSHDARSRRTQTTGRGRVPFGATWRIRLLLPRRHLHHHHPADNADAPPPPRSCVSTLIHLPPFIISTPADGNAIVVRDGISGKVTSDNLSRRGDLRDAPAPCLLAVVHGTQRGVCCVNEELKPASGAVGAQVHRQALRPCTGSSVKRQRRGEKTHLASR